MTDKTEQQEKDTSPMEEGEILSSPMSFLPKQTKGKSGNIQANQNRGPVGPPTPHPERFDGIAAPGRRHARAPGIAYGRNYRDRDRPEDLDQGYGGSARPGQGYFHSSPPPRLRSNPPPPLSPRHARYLVESGFKGPLTRAKARAQRYKEKHGGSQQPKKNGGGGQQSKKTKKNPHHRSYNHGGGFVQPKSKHVANGQSGNGTSPIPIVRMGEYTVLPKNAQVKTPANGMVEKAQHAKQRGGDSRLADRKWDELAKEDEQKSNEKARKEVAALEAEVERKRLKVRKDKLARESRELDQVLKMNKKVGGLTKQVSNGKPQCPPMMMPPVGPSRSGTRHPLQDDPKVPNGPKAKNPHSRPQPSPISHPGVPRNSSKTVPEFVPGPILVNQGVKVGSDGAVPLVQVVKPAQKRKADEEGDEHESKKVRQELIVLPMDHGKKREVSQKAQQGKLSVEKEAEETSDMEVRAKELEKKMEWDALNDNVLFKDLDELIGRRVV
ncbi:hypothetical protein EJ08DRAFT_711350 [Tothia fuscella]|uniref:Uncharacterized protein n=1 Tax=Tothia fuscella TaxID=1048955 RepID=A0A9P4U4U7_9PEZI|nr:hypothetical protein EJ08DRAFT_711350 [Tothia fuscella]